MHISNSWVRPPHNAHSGRIICRNTQHGYYRRVLDPRIRSPKPFSVSLVESLSGKARPLHAKYPQCYFIEEKDFIWLEISRLRGMSLMCMFGHSDACCTCAIVIRHWLQPFPSGMQNALKLWHIFRYWYRDFWHSEFLCCRARLVLQTCRHSTTKLSQYLLASQLCWRSSLERF